MTEARVEASCVCRAIGASSGEITRQKSSKLCAKCTNTRDVCSAHRRVLLCVYMCVCMSVYRYICNIYFKVSVHLAISTSRERVGCIPQILSWLPGPAY